MHSSAMRAIGGTISSKRPGDEPYRRWMLEPRKLLRASAASSGTVISKMQLRFYEGPEGQALFEQSPIAVFDANQHAGAIVEAGMVLWRGIVDAVGPDQVMNIFQGVTQRRPKLGSARLGLLHGDRNGGVEQQVGVIGIPAG